MPNDPVRSRLAWLCLVGMLSAVCVGAAPVEQGTMDKHARALVELLGWRVLGQPKCTPEPIRLWVHHAGVTICNATITRTTLGPDVLVTIYCDHGGTCWLPAGYGKE